MSEEIKKTAGAIHIPKELTGNQFHLQEEMIMKSAKQDKLTFGIPLEITLQENRVPLVPASVASHRSFASLAAFFASSNAFQVPSAI